MARGFQNALLKAFGSVDHDMTVLWTRDITPGFRRIRFHAPTMIDGRETPPASFVRLWAPDPDGSGKVHQRGYTLIDADSQSGEVSFDFVMHQPAGPAASWAAAAKPGDKITASFFGYTKFTPPDPEPEGYLLIGDPSAIPAINTILASLPSHARISVLLVAVSPGDEDIPVAPHAGADITWLTGGADAVVASIPTRDWSNWYAWVAGEASIVKAVRASLNKRHGFPLADIQHRAYWILGKAMRLKKEEAEPDAAAPPIPVAAKQEEPAPASRWRSQRGVELLHPLRWKLRTAGVIQGLVSILQIAPFVLIAEIGRKLLADEADWNAYRPLVIATLALFGTAATLSSALLFWLHAVDARFGRDLRLMIVAKMTRLPLGWFTDRNAASVRAIAQDDTGRLHYMVTHAVLDAVAGAVTPLLVIAYLFTVDAGLAGLLFLPLVAFVVLFSFMMRGVGDKLAQVAEWTKRVTAAANAFVEALPVARVFGGDGQTLRGALNGQIQFLNAWQRPMMGRKILSQIAVQPTTFLLLILGFGLWRISAGVMSRADILPFLFLGTAFGTQIMAVFYGFLPIREGRAAARRIGVLLETPELDRSQATQTTPPGPVGLRFRSVSFGYRPQTPVLHDITLDLEPGSLTALVGPSGAGKSTLATLPGRFFDVTQGAILLPAGDDDIDIRTLRPDALAATVGFVFQDVRLIRATISENIALTRPGADARDIEAAARAAQIHDRIVQCPRGYDSVIGEEVTFSGGEAQRLSIARALLADPPLLVLDEATAFADPESEYLVQKALTALIGRRTVLVVAHRLHTVMHADRIVVMEGGRIVQQGRHDALLAQPGLYRDLWRAGEGDAP